ncbi:MAG: hypothetical protein WC700_04320 [Gemmatimonadaceae bacterium]|jgi:hypothetical protein
MEQIEKHVDIILMKHALVRIKNMVNDCLSNINHTIANVESKLAEDLSVAERRVESIAELDEKIAQARDRIHEAKEFCDHMYRSRYNEELPRSLEDQLKDSIAEESYQESNLEGLQKQLKDAKQELGPFLKDLWRVEGKVSEYRFWFYHGCVTNANYRLHDLLKAYLAAYHAVSCVESELTFPRRNAELMISLECAVRRFLADATFHYEIIYNSLTPYQTSPTSEIRQDMNARAQISVSLTMIERLLYAIARKDIGEEDAVPTQPIEDELDERFQSNIPRITPRQGNNN